MPVPSKTRTQIITKWSIICLVILGPCLVTFGGKIQMLIEAYQGEAEWAFAVTPVVNYVIASAGFVCLFIWAALNGMFRDLEEPKLTMLANEQLLDQLEHASAVVPLSAARKSP
ncbi:MAG: hypothetical protein SFX18_00415 [Pirellulales bacterium]|nr:hypothetical protein [Pirellulales bacterium]